MMPTSSHHPGAADSAAVKVIAHQHPLMESTITMPQRAVIAPTKPDWLAFPAGALNFSPAYG